MEALTKPRPKLGRRPMYTPEQLRRIRREIAQEVLGELSDRLFDLAACKALQGALAALKTEVPTS
jgi:hypothetical protein